MENSKTTTITNQQYASYWQQFKFCQADEKCYLEQAHYKKNYWLSQFSEHLNHQPPHLDEIEFFHSPASHFRYRIEFAIRKFDHELAYAMFDRINKQPIAIQTCQHSALAISEAMPILMTEINKHPILAERCQQINFRTNLQNELLITLIYRQDIEKKKPQFLKKISELQQKYHWNIIVRSHKKHWFCKQGYIDYTITLGEQTYTYLQDDNTFTQPNALINTQMLAWVSKHLSSNPEQNMDLLELYCGNGNFTIALAKQFRQVLATEVVRESLKLANLAKAKNNMHNIHFVRLSAEETSQALSGYRSFNRLKSIPLSDYQFSTVLVDPPRSGIDNNTLQFLQKFQRIIYISCNPLTLIANLNTLNSHRITQLALFDQFPYTHHIESIVILEKIKTMENHNNDNKRSQYKVKL